MKKPFAELIFAISLLVHPSPRLAASEIELISVPYDFQPGSFGDSSDISFSADGKWAIFSSTGNGLVAGDTNGFNIDIFRRNLETGQTTLLSARTNGSGGSGHSYGAEISADGQSVLFVSEADDLVAGDDNGGADVFLYTASGLRSLTEGFAGASGAATMTPDAKFILFESDANGLSPLDTNGAPDLYLLDVARDELSLVNVNAAGTSAAQAGFPSTDLGLFDASLSDDGRHVAFVSGGSNLVSALRASSNPQVYLRDMTAGTNRWLSRRENGQASLNAATPRISPNGAYVAFMSEVLETNTLGGYFLYLYETASGSVGRLPGTNFVEFHFSGDSRFLTYGADDQVYLYDLAAKTNRLVSVAADGSPGSGASDSPVISSNGQYVVFTTIATNLAAGITEEAYQACLFDAATGEVRLLSRGVAGIPAERDVLFPAISADGSMIGFMSYASNLATNDNELSNDVFVVPATGSDPVQLVSAPSPNVISATPSGYSSVEALSLDGRFAIFSSVAPNIVPEDQNGPTRDIYLRDLRIDRTRLVNRETNSTQLPGTATYLGMSLDGKTIAFVSSNLLGTAESIYLYDNSTARVTIGSVLPDGQIAVDIQDPLLSPNGRYLAFRTPDPRHLYIRDLAAGSTIQYSEDGQPLAFSTTGRLLITAPDSGRTTIHEWQQNRVVATFSGLRGSMTNALAGDESFVLIGTRLGITSDVQNSLYSLQAGSTNLPFATNAIYPVISLDGSTVVYSSPLRTNGTNEYRLYVYDVASGGTTEILGPNGSAIAIQENPALSADGRFITITTTNVLTGAAGDDGFTDVYRYDRVLKSFTLVSRSLAGGESRASSHHAAISADGRTVVFSGMGDDLVANDLNLLQDAFASHIDPVDTDSDGLEDGWETIHFGALSHDAAADTDGDGISNLDELRAGTDPASATSRFALTARTDAAREVLTFTASASPGRVYQLQHRESLTEKNWLNLGSPIVASGTEIEIEVPVDSTQSGFFRLWALE